MKFELNLLNEEKNTNLQATLIRELRLDFAKLENEVKSLNHFYNNKLNEFTKGERKKNT